MIAHVLYLVVKTSSNISDGELRCDKDKSEVETSELRLGF
jgi:hypothetical protein